jgi:hypothetical protein
MAEAYGTVLALSRAHFHRSPCRESAARAADPHPVPEIRNWHNAGIMDGTVLDRVLVHVLRGSRVAKRATP